LPFDGATPLRIHLLLALGLALGAALGIPRLAVGAQAIGVGADRLALAARPGRQRLAVGAQPGRLRRAGLAGRTGLAGRARLTRQRLAVRAELLRLVTATVTTVTEATTRARTAIAPIATVAAGTTGTTKPAGTARTTGATRTARATRTSRASTRATATAAFASEIARRRGELPADACARHLAATRPIVILGLVLRPAQLEAAQTARLVPPIASRAAAIAVAASAIAAAPIIATAVAAPALGRGDAVDRVVELAAGDRAVRALLALEHADQADLVDAITNDIERFDHARGAVRLHTQRGGHRGDDRIGRLIRRRIGGAPGRRLGSCVAAGLAPGFPGLAGFRRRLLLRGALLGALRGVHRRIELGGGSTRVRAARGSACSRCLAQGERRELGERLHGRLATPKVPATPGLGIAIARRRSGADVRAFEHVWPRM
jgi:hypothetical protein